MIWVRDKDKFYEDRRRRIWELYWGRGIKSIYQPSGFTEYPHEVYDLFLSLIDHDGRVLDLGCGNGLLLRHLVKRSKFKLEPYGVDFIRESIEQARELILPEYRDNFILMNIAEYPLEEEYYDYIFFDPYDIYPPDLPGYALKVLKACRRNGKVIFYTYRDVLNMLRLTNLMRLKIIMWVGDLLPKPIRRRLVRIEHRDVSIGVYRR